MRLVSQLVASSAKGKNIIKSYMILEGASESSMNSDSASSHLWPTTPLTSRTELMGWETKHSWIYFTECQKLVIEQGPSEEAEERGSWIISVLI